MIKRAMLISIVFFFAAPFSHAEDKFSVSGEVLYKGAESIFVCLHTEETLQNFTKALPPQAFVQVVKAISNGRASFKVDDIPEGYYVLMVFIDKNNNGKFDCDSWGRPVEPFLMYKTFRWNLNWFEQRFKVDKDVTGIALEF